MKYIKISLFACLFLHVLFLLIYKTPGIATGTLWHKRPYIKTKILKKIHSTSDCLIIAYQDLDKPGHDSIYIPYAPQENDNIIQRTSQLYTTGFLKFTPNQHSSIIGRIHKIYNITDSTINSVIIRIWIATTPEGEEKQTAGFELSIFRSIYVEGKFEKGEGIYKLGGRSPFDNLGKMKISFVKEIDKKSTNFLTIKPNLIEINTIEYSLIKRNRMAPKAVLIAFTPFTILFDFFTIPFQFIIFLTIPLWLPA